MEVQRQHPSPLARSATAASYGTQKISSFVFHKVTCTALLITMFHTLAYFAIFLVASNMEFPSLPGRRLCQRERRFPLPSHLIPASLRSSQCGMMMHQAFMLLCHKSNKLTQLDFYQYFAATVCIQMKHAEMKHAWRSRPACAQRKGASLGFQRGRCCLPSQHLWSI